MWNTARSMWAEPAVGSAPTRVGRSDQVLATVVLVMTTVEVVSRPGLGWRPAAAGLGVVLAVAVLVRRSRRLAAVAIAFGAFLVIDVVAFVVDAEPVALYSGAVVLALIYSLFRWDAGRDVLLGAVIVLAELTISTITDFSGSADAVGGAAVLLFAAALGAAVRYQTLARQQLIEQAKLQERAHLARELHDVVAHHVSAIAVQAQAGLVLTGSASLEGAAEALEIINREAATTLVEMRWMVGALRDHREQAPVAPGRHLADIERLSVTSTDALRVDVELHGELSDLSPAVEAALHRVAQESVTNARRHARLATRVEVTVTGSATDVRLTVSDDGAGTPTGKTPGYGLVGMTERVTLLGGTLQTGPGPDRGWCVRAVLPRPRSGA